MNDFENNIKMKIIHGLERAFEQQIIELFDVFVVNLSLDSNPESSIVKFTRGIGLAVDAYRKAHDIVE